MLAQFAIRRHNAVQRYTQFIAEGIDRESILRNLNRQVFLGDDQFVSRMQAKTKMLSKDVNATRVQKRPPAPPLQAIVEAHESRNHAIVAAYASGAYSYQQIAELFGLHFTAIGKIVRTAKAAIRMQ